MHEARTPDNTRHPLPGVRATFLRANRVTVFRGCVNRLPMSVFGLHVNRYLPRLRPLRHRYLQAENTSVIGGVYVLCPGCRPKGPAG